ncbi:stage III sporulation protein AF [Fictibacillus phosphorivorans]|uniref:stage III sporulation protein AF n=1 Tax=Fictibacillus phosphorivorans TaxID=1221500 RepID=UPI003CECD3BD
MTEWIRNIIVIIFLSIMVEMMMPNTNFQHYIKMTVGFIIVAVMLHPLLSLFNPSVERAVNSFSNLSTLSDEDMKDSIIENQEKIESNQREQTHNLVSQKIKKDVELELMKHFNLECQVSDLTFSDDKNTLIKHITLTVKQDINRKVVSIKDVSIDKNERQSDEAQKAQLTNDVKKFLAEEWDIAMDAVILHIE